MYLRWALLAPISLAFNLFVVLTSPIWALWAAVFKLRQLPWIFALVHTHDDDIYGSNTTHEPVPFTIIARFKRAVWWLVRNPGYGFDTHILGFDHRLMVFEYVSPPVEFDSGKTVSRFWLMLLPDGSYRFCYRRDQMLFGNRWCKIFIGWHWEVKAAGRHMFKCQCNPCRTLP